MRTIIFDLDNTLCESKESIEQNMVESLIELANQDNNIAIVSGASFEQINKRVLSYLENYSNRLLHSFYILPSSGGAFYKRWFNYGWLPVYEYAMTKSDYSNIEQVVLDVAKVHGPSKVWGKLIENRETQVTYSLLGHKASVSDKKSFDSDYRKRIRIVEELNPKLPGFDIFMGGLSSIDICLKGINKQFGVDQLMRSLNVGREEVICVGDAFFEGGNNYMALEMSLDYVAVHGVEDTYNWIQQQL